MCISALMGGWIVDEFLIDVPPSATFLGPFFRLRLASSACRVLNYFRCVQMYCSMTHSMDSVTTRIEVTAVPVRETWALVIDRVSMVAVMR